MQTSILWEGSLPSKEEMEKMKQEGYLFRAGEGGWKICLKLHNTPTGTWYADNFSKSFLKEVELHQYLEEVEKRATWFEFESRKRESIAPCFRRKGSGSAFSRKKRVSGISLTGGFYACQCLHTWRV